MLKVIYSGAAVLVALVVTLRAGAAEPTTLEAARAEGKVVVSIPPNADLRKELEQAFEKRYPGIDLETVSSRGSKAVRRIADEAKSKVPYFDVHIGGTLSMLSGLVAPGLVQPLAPLMERPDVKDPALWWGGHIYADGANKFAYSFMGYLSENLYYNSNDVDPKEILSYNDLLNPKWHGKIGFFDPRTPGPGDSTWTYLWEVMGDAYLRRLVQQKLLISRNRRQLAESLIKGKLAITIGMSYYSLSRFVKAGLPLKALPIPKEGTYPTGGTGVVVVLKDNPHPNATRVFVNWLLSQEGQEIFARVMGHVSRRFDVDSSWAKELGILGTKDVMSVSDYHKYENQSEKKIAEVRMPAGKLARELLR